MLRRGWGRTELVVGATALVVALVALTVTTTGVGRSSWSAAGAARTAADAAAVHGVVGTDRMGLDTGLELRTLRAAELRASRAERRRALEALLSQRRASQARARAIAAERARAAEKAASSWSGGDSWAWAHQPFAEHIQYCESGDNPRAVDPSGQHFGEWQFLLSTWQSVGGIGNPIDASLAEQDYRAWLLWKRDGWGQWQCASM